MTRRVKISDQSIDALAEIISGGSANVTDPSIGLYRQGWKLEAWFMSFDVPFDIKSESRLPATRIALRGTLLLDNGDLMKRMIEKAADPRDGAPPQKSDSDGSYDLPSVGLQARGRPSSEDILMENMLHAIGHVAH